MLGLKPIKTLPIREKIAGKLPSTSPANAACRPDQLKEIWGNALERWILP